MKFYNIKKDLVKTIHSFKIAFPMIIGVFLLVNLIIPLLGKHFDKFFTGNYLIDPLIGAFVGSISFGIPLTSYIAGGELLKQGISLVAVTAFILTWTTVGVVMLPLEISFLGKRFAITRNIVNFIFAIIISILTVVTLNILPWI